MIPRLFGRVPLPDSGFSITVRTHPWNPAEVVAIVTTDSAGDVKEDTASAMRDYRRYSTVRFRDGKAVFKQTEHSERGICVAVP